MYEFDWLKCAQKSSHAKRKLLTGALKLPWRTFLQAAATHIPSAIVWCALGHHPLCDPVGQLGAVGQLGGRVICLGKNGSNDSNFTFPQLPSWYYTSQTWQWRNGCLQFWRLPQLNDDVHSVDSPTFGCPPRLAWSSNPKNVFPNIMRLQNPPTSSICTVGHSRKTLPLRVFQWVYFDLEQSTSCCCCRWFPVFFLVINPNLV